MDFKNVLVLIGSLLNLFFALIVHFRSKKSRANTLFEITIYAIVGWCLSMLFYRNSQTLNSSLFWVRFLYFFPTFIPSGFLLFGLHFPNASVKKRTILLIVILNICMATLTLIPNAVIDTVNIPKTGEKLIDFGWAYYLYTLYIPGLFTASYFVLLRKYKNTTSFIKSQLHYIMLGLIIASGVGMVTNLILPTFGNFKANWMGQFFTFIWVGGATYAIVRHKLMDIKIVAAQVLTFSIWIALLVRIFIYSTPKTLIIDIPVLVLTVVFGLLLVRSVMQEVRQREQLQNLTSRLKAMDKQKDEFISVAAHELRAPMTAIKGYLSMLIDGDAGKITKPVKDYLSDAIEGSDRLVRLVNNMLNVGRIEEGRLTFSMGYVHLKSVVEETYEEFKFEAERRKLEFKVDADKKIKDLVFVDKDRIHEIVANLVSNAVKYTDSGSVTVKLSNPDSKSIKCEVIDTGKGISEKEQEKLFQKFGRAESASGKTIGTGLGLYISKLLVKKFGGEIGLVSEFNKGSNFYFTLPLSKDRS